MNDHDVRYAFYLFYVDLVFKGSISLTRHNAVFLSFPPFCTCAPNPINPFNRNVPFYLSFPHEQQTFILS